MSHLINYSKCQRNAKTPAPPGEIPISGSSSKWINGKRENGKRKEKWNTKCLTRRGRPGSRPFTQATYSSLALSPPARYKFKIKVRNSPSRTRERDERVVRGTSHDSRLASRWSSCCSKWGWSSVWGDTFVVSIIISANVPTRIGQRPGMARALAPGEAEREREREEQK